MKLLIMKSSPVFCHFVALILECSPQHPVSKHPLSMFTPIQNNSQNYSYVYFNLKVFGEEMGRQKILNRKTASIPRI
jgi:hypothetical protein